MTPAITITRHAIRRWIERVDPRATEQSATTAILCHERAIRAALDFHAPTVLLGSGTRLIVKNGAVVTVYSRGWFTPRQERFAGQHAMGAA